MRLAVCSMAFVGTPWSIQAFDYLRAEGLGVEWAAHHLPHPRAADLPCPALQSLFPGFPASSAHHNIFGGPARDFAVCEATLARLVECAGLAASMDAGVLVFGSPGVRDPGDLTDEEARLSATHFFRRACAATHPLGVTIALEAVPHAYGNRFLNQLGAVVDFCAWARIPGLEPHLDTGAAAMAVDNPVGSFTPAHVHVSEPYLSDFAAPAAPHREYAAFLRGVGYDGWLSVEMRPHGMDAIKRAVDFVRETYGGYRCASP